MVAALEVRGPIPLWYWECLAVFQTALNITGMVAALEVRGPIPLWYWETFIEEAASLFWTNLASYDI